MTHGVSYIKGCVSKGSIWRSKINYELHHITYDGWKEHMDTYSV